MSRPLAHSPRPVKMLRAAPIAKWAAMLTEFLTKHADSVMIIPLHDDMRVSGYETMNMIRKGQVKGVDKGNLLAQVHLVNPLFGVAA